MKLWKLTARDDFWKGHKANPWAPWYDKNFGFVVTADSEERARELAAQVAKDEGPEAWLKLEFSICRELKVDNFVGEQIVMTDFHAR